MFRPMKYLNNFKLEHTRIMTRELLEGIRTPNNLSEEDRKFYEKQEKEIIKEQKFRFEKI